MKKNLRVAVLFAAVNIAFGAVFGLLAQQPQMVGDYRERSKTDPEVVAAAKYAIKRERRKQGVRISLISLERAEAQVVAGMNYRLCLRVKMKGETQNVTAVVYRNLKRKYALSSWESDGCKKQE